ncbi:MAG: glycosyltransferase family 39 protein [Acidobacteriia bacterium]|nr:glycosyltransferase family 39 protein [Terriglobia bacterium]
MLPLVLAVALIKLWLIPAGASFWVDETVTAFVVHQGGEDASLAVAPQVPKSIYYGVARMADGLFGTSEFGYRIPSMLAAALALFLIGRLAARLIHPDAAWFAIFACLSLKGVNAEATDARPYALGFCVAAASFLFLVRWLDGNRWLDAALFVAMATLLWRVHLIFWPIYLVLCLYALIRRVRGETEVSWLRVLGAFALVGIALLPVAMDAIALNRGAGDHVIVDLPRFHDLTASLKGALIGSCAMAGVFIWMIAGQKSEDGKISSTAAVLALGWWLVQPASLFAYSRFTGNSLFVGRYLSIGLPGAALAGTLLAGWFLPARFWKPAALVLGLGALYVLRHGAGQQDSDWRGASASIARYSPETPVICPSPFIEAKAPEWSPGYHLPGFLYAHLATYPVRGRIFLFPYRKSAAAERYAAKLSRETLPASGRFVIYGGAYNTHVWRNWFRERPEFAGWNERSLGQFGDVDAVVFERRPAILPARSER